MPRFYIALQRLIAHDHGQDLVEYGLLAMLIAVLVTAAATAFGQQLNLVFWDYIAGTV